MTFASANSIESNLKRCRKVYLHIRYFCYSTTTSEYCNCIEFRAKKIKFYTFFSTLITRDNVLFYGNVLGSFHSSINAKWWDTKLGENNFELFPTENGCSCWFYLFENTRHGKTLEELLILVISNEINIVVFSSTCTIRQI